MKRLILAVAVLVATGYAVAQRPVTVDQSTKSQMNITSPDSFLTLGRYRRISGKLLKIDTIPVDYATGGGFKVRLNEIVGDSLYLAALMDTINGATVTTVSRRVIIEGRPWFDSTDIKIKGGLGTSWTRWKLWPAHGAFGDTLARYDTLTVGAWYVGAFPGWEWRARTGAWDSTDQDTLRKDRLHWRAFGKGR